MKTIKFIEQTRYLALDHEIDDELTVSDADAKQLIENNHAVFVTENDSKILGEE